MFAQAIKAVGAAHCVLSSDTGQYFSPSPPEAMRLFIALMLGCGMSKADLELMVKTNPARLLGLR